MILVILGFTLYALIKIITSWPGKLRAGLALMITSLPLSFIKELLSMPEGWVSAAITVGLCALLMTAVTALVKPQTSRSRAST